MGLGSSESLNLGSRLSLVCLAWLVTFFAKASPTPQNCKQKNARIRHGSPQIIGHFLFEVSRCLHQKLAVSKPVTIALVFHPYTTEYGLRIPYQVIIYRGMLKMIYSCSFDGHLLYLICSLFFLVPLPPRVILLVNMTMCFVMLLRKSSRAVLDTSPRLFPCP